MFLVGFVQIRTWTHFNGFGAEIFHLPVFNSILEVGNPKTLHSSSRDFRKAH